MTWQRINENIYIDDSLVICAEYQLFVDEMREQRKFYEPDHWYSYRFPASHAREPILGVRFSDAKAFCTWLLRREKEEWHYRLPTQVEAIENPMRNIRSNVSLGFWSIGLNNQARFAWVCRLSDDDQTIDIEFIINSEIQNLLEEERARYFKSGEMLDYRRYSDLEVTMNAILNRHIDSNTAMREAMSKIYGYRPTLDEVINALQERIAGRSPAFEGIRLVKERAK